MDERTYIPDEVGETDSYRGDSVPEFPLHLDVEASNRCNLNCTFCDKQPLLKEGLLGDMDLSLFKKIVTESVAGRCESIGLSYRGEPLLNEHIVEFVSFAKESGIKWVSFCTNGMLLVPNTAKQLIDAGLDEITISAQGGDAESFEYKRLGASFFIVSRNVEYMMSLKEKSGKANPLIRIQAVDLEDFDRKSFYDHWKDRSDKIVIVPYEEAIDRKNIPPSDWICPQTYRRLTIEQDGTILPCNNDDIRERALGNASEIRIGDAWNSETMKELRRKHLLGDYDDIPDCRQCPFRYSAVVKNNQYISKSAAYIS